MGTRLSLPWNANTMSLFEESLYYRLTNSQWTNCPKIINQTGFYFLPFNHCSNYTRVVEIILAYGNRVRSTHCGEISFFETMQSRILLQNYSILTSPWPWVVVWIPAVTTAMANPYFMPLNPTALSVLWPLELPMFGCLTSYRQTSLRSQGS